MGYMLVVSHSSSRITASDSLLYDSARNWPLHVLSLGYHSRTRYCHNASIVEDGQDDLQWGGNQKSRFPLELHIH